MQTEYTHITHTHCATATESNDKMFRAIDVATLMLLLVPSSSSPSPQYSSSGIIAGTGISSTADPDFITYPVDLADWERPAGINVSVLPGAGNVPGKPAPASGVDGYLAVVTNGAPHLRAFGPLGGHPCGKRVKTSVTARAHGCRLATNAAPFNMETGACDCGVYISNGEILGSGGWKPSFSVTGDGRQWVIGTLNASVAASLNVSQSLTGFGWLVRDGANAIAADKPNMEIAPRTAIGISRAGELLLLEVDGCEPQRHCRWEIGKTEHAMAELLLQHGAYHAINLDGGGSSSFVVNGTVRNHPTDLDLWLLKRERAVTVISCVL